MPRGSMPNEEHEVPHPYDEYCKFFDCNKPKSMLNKIDRLHDELWASLNTEQRKKFVEWFDNLVQEIDKSSLMPTKELKELLKNIK